MYGRKFLYLLFFTLIFLSFVSTNPVKDDDDVSFDYFFGTAPTLRSFLDNRAPWSCMSPNFRRFCDLRCRSEGKSSRCIYKFNTCECVDKVKEAIGTSSVKKELDSNLYYSTPDTAEPLKPGEYNDGGSLLIARALRSPDVVDSMTLVDLSLVNVPVKVAAPSTRKVANYSLVNFHEKPTLRHHIAHFCPNLEIARKCIKICMKQGKPTFCGKDHQCYCGHQAEHPEDEKDMKLNTQNNYIEFQDMYEKYFGKDWRTKLEHEYQVKQDRENEKTSTTEKVALYKYF